MRIGEMASECGVSVPTLRFYEKLGLLPAPPRSVSGYRDYPPEAARAIQFIRFARQRGFSLKELESLVREGASARPGWRATRKAFERKARGLEKEIARLQKALGDLHSCLEKCGCCNAARPRPRSR
jgi:DNA-binding transcriptional MerR regulator